MGDAGCACGAAGRRQVDEPSELAVRVQRLELRLRVCGVFMTRELSPRCREGGLSSPGLEVSALC